MCIYVDIGDLLILWEKLVKDFIDEPMFVAKFSHPLNCILECALINIVGM